MCNMYEASIMKEAYEMPRLPKPCVEYVTYNSEVESRVALWKAAINAWRHVKAGGEGKNDETMTMKQLAGEPAIDA